MKITITKSPTDYKTNINIKGTVDSYVSSDDGEVLELETIPPFGVVKIENDSDKVTDRDKAKCGNGVEIDGFLFIPDEIKGDETYRKREFSRTKIMSGGEFVSRTTYTPRAYSFSCSFDVEEDEPYYYDLLFTKMQNHKCKIISPYISSAPFYGSVIINKDNPKSSPNTIRVNVKITEIPDALLQIEGDKAIEYPSTTALSNAAIKVTREGSADDLLEEVAGNLGGDVDDRNKYKYQNITGNFTS